MEKSDLRCTADRLCYVNIRYSLWTICWVSVAVPWTHKSTVLFPSEEAVNEVKRQAMSELQKAVSEAERKAHEMISTERAKMERTVAEAKRQAAEDALSVINQQEDSSEVTACTPTTHCYYISWPAAAFTCCTMINWDGNIFHKLIIFCNIYNLGDLILCNVYMPDLIGLGCFSSMAYIWSP